MSAPQFGLLGPVCAWRDGEEIDLGPGKQRAVLAVLLLRANRPVPATEIVDAVWGEEPPGNGLNVVQKHVSGLRRALEPDRQPRLPSQLLMLTDAGYTMRVEPGTLDLDAFRTEVDQAYSAQAGGAIPHAVDSLRAALARWRGPALAGLPGRFFDTERDLLTEIRMSALEDCLDLELRLGRHVKLVPELTALIGEFPLRERPRGLLMLALHRSGRLAESLAVYREARRYLIEELGAEPGDELRRVHREILAAGQPVAGPAPAPPPTPPMPPPPPARQPAPRRDGTSWAARLGTLPLPLVPVVSAGTLSWASAAYAAARLRSPLHGAIAAVYFVLAVVTFAVTDPDSSRYSPAIATAAILPAWIGGTVHGVLLRSRLLRLRASLSDPLVELARERRRRRQSALQVLRREPALARDLRIGRPDLPRQYDDGGLVDVNNVPEHVLTTALGITREQAQRIVVERQRTGGFASVGEIATRGLLPAAVVRSFDDVLIAIR